jgi:hypothetical protein
MVALRSAVRSATRSVSSSPPVVSNACDHDRRRRRRHRPIRSPRRTGLPIDARRSRALALALGLSASAFIGDVGRSRIPNRSRRFATRVADLDERPAHRRLPWVAMAIVPSPIRVLVGS